MQSLKALVVGMGILIVAMVTVLGWGLYKKGSDPDFKFFDLSGSSSKSTPDAPGPSVPGIQSQAPRSNVANPFSDLMLGIPEKCSVDEMATEGDLLYLRLGPPLSDCERILVIDGKRGKQLGSIDIRR